jgi:hypothetical protein
MMKKLWGAFKGWRNPNWAKVRAKGAWPTFLYSMLDGLIRGILLGVLMGSVVLVGAFRGESLWTRAAYSLAGGLIIGCIIGLGRWVVNVNERAYEEMKRLEARPHK